MLPVVRGTRRLRPAAWLLALGFGIAACAEGRARYAPGPDTVIATARDSGRDAGTLPNGGGGIAYDPDGCQGWIIDDGVEGYAGRRFDPATGLPVCDGRYPPGTVLRGYQAPGAGIRDYVPAVGRVADE